jgi:hypothetical protein
MACLRLDVTQWRGRTHPGRRRSWRWPDPGGGDHPDKEPEQRLGGVERGEGGDAGREQGQDDLPVSGFAGPVMGQLGGTS